MDMLRSELRALEVRAGIQEELAKYGDYETPYHLRLIVFAVPGEGLRRKLIAKMREIDTEADRGPLARIDDARADLAEAKQKAGNTPWVIPSVLACVAVWIGWTFEATPGALAGALVGWFIAQAYLSSVREHHRTEVEGAANYLQSAVDDHQTYDKDLSPWDGVFSSTEAAFGEPDEQSPRPTSRARA